MGKRSWKAFERNPNDCYTTPTNAVEPLLPHLTYITFMEPCAGDGSLVKHLEAAGYNCVHKSDIDPKDPSIKPRDALTLTKHVLADAIITNPPWDRKLLHPMIEHFSSMLPTWLLFDADWMHTGQSRDYIPYLKKIVSVGRVKWIEGSPYIGKDNCCWYLFDQAKNKKDPGMIEFIGRTDPPKPRGPRKK